MDRRRPAAPRRRLRQGVPLVAVAALPGDLQPASVGNRGAHARVFQPLLPHHGGIIRDVDIRAATGAPVSLRP